MSKLLESMTDRQRREQAEGGAPGGGSTRALQNPAIAKKLQDLQKQHTDHEEAMDRLAREQRRQKNHGA
jgi:hypothetical protein